MDDKQFLLNLGIIAKLSQIKVLPGDGVDLQRFYFVGYTNLSHNVIKHIEHSGHMRHMEQGGASQNITFIYSGRLLWDKGLGELAVAMRKVKASYPQVKLIVIGNYFLDNPAAIKPEMINAWQQEGLIEYLGMVDDVVPIVAKSDCLVLPSYREGLPRAILEASSMGKPVITVTSIGCRDVVLDRITGLIARVNDADDLAAKLIEFIELPLAKKQQMGIAGRQFIEQQFDQQIVIDSYIKCVVQLVEPPLTLDSMADLDDVFASDKLENDI